MSAISGVVSSILSSDAQEDAANTASQAQQAASRYAIDMQAKSSAEALQFQRDAFNTAQSQFQPYLNAGKSGLSQLQGNMPRIFQRTIAPIAQQYGQYESPTLPEFSYEFNREDPVYQQKLSETNESIDKFLAKQGLQGSSAGEAFRQKQIQSMMAQDESRQYGRATDTYNRDLSGTLTKDQMDRGLMLSQYDVAKDSYGTQYGGQLDLAKMGAGAAGSAGSASMTTGTNMANTSLQTGQAMGAAAMQAGNAQAQGALAAGQAQAGMWQSFGNTAAGMGNLAMQYFGPQQQTPSYGGSGWGGQYSSPMLNQGYMAAPASNAIAGTGMSR